MEKIIYRSCSKDEELRAFPLKARSCKIKYFTEESLSQFDKIVCEILLGQENLSMKYDELGFTLGFNMYDLPEENSYKDEAEINIFSHLLSPLFSWGLINNEEGILKLTTFGEIAITKGIKYKFWEANVECAEFTKIHNEDGTDIVDFPFYDELGYNSSITKATNIKYDVVDPNVVEREIDNQLVKTLSLQVNKSIHIYQAEQTKYISLPILKLDVELVQVESKYVVKFYNGVSECKELNHYFNLEINYEAKDNKVERALYTKLMNDEHAILTYELLCPFIDIIEYHKIIKDKRTKWTDSQLVELITTNCDVDDWTSLSRYCDIDVLKTLISSHSEKLNWATLTLRLDSNFIYNNSCKYPWVKSLLTKRNVVDKRLLEKFLSEHVFVDCQDDDEWDWNEIVPVIGIDFIVNNIKTIPFNLDLLTSRLTEENRNLVSLYPEAAWNWYFVTREYPIEFILDQIKILGTFLPLSVLIDRIFTNEEYIQKALNTNDLKSILKDIEYYKIFNANSKNYIWSDAVIKFFEATEMINWEGGAYSNGFVSNPHLKWTNEFFNRYYTNLTTESSINIVSSKIEDNLSISEHLDFNWNWQILSRNKIVYNDVDFVRKYIDRLDAQTILLNCSDNLIEEYFEIFNVASLIQSDIDLQTRVTDCVSIEFLRSHINLCWDWSRLTKRVYNTIKLNNVGLPIWRDKWDWDFLSSNISIDDIIEYARIYSDKWVWKTVINRISISKLLEGGALEVIANVLNSNDENTTEWSLLTSKFDTESLLALVENNQTYKWNYEDLYSRPDFDAKKYMTDSLELIKWTEFSASQSVNKIFGNVSKNKRQSIWIRIYTDILNDEKNKWNYKKLTTLSNIIKQPSLFQLDKDWDWDIISRVATWISTEKGSDYYFKKFISLLSFNELSKRTDIGLTEKIIVKYDKKYNWNWDALVENESIDFSFDYIREYIEKKWNWHKLSKRQDLQFEFVLDFEDKDWDWEYLTSIETFVPSCHIISHIQSIGKPIDWNAISSNPNLDVETIREYRNCINWEELVGNNKSFMDLMSVAFLQEFFDYVPWTAFNQRIGVHVTNEIVDAFADYLDWRNVSYSQELDFNVPFIQKYENKWYWSILNNNPKVIDTVPNYARQFASRVQSTVFIDRLKEECDIPHIYHFTHLYNAIEVIKNRKILSRNRAIELGLLKYDSAGSVIGRSSAAHSYARFYFRPCTPTQYYNEALGADSTLGEYGPMPIYNEWGEKEWVQVFKSKYPKAKDLGLPKCPMPVFFRFDIEEVLSQMPEICYYSDRNMQSNNPCIYKVIETPNNLGVTYLYYTMDRAKREAKSGGGYDSSIIDNYMRYSQQEFLVKGEFDFSKLNSLQIICYNEEFAQLLKETIGDDPICKKIVSYTNESIFEFENRSLSLNRFPDRSVLTSNYQGEHYYEITSNNLNDVHFDFSSANVLFEDKNSLRVKGIIKWNNTTSDFKIYFVDPNARTKKWLIYSNNGNINNIDTKFPVSDFLKKSIFNFDAVIGSLPIKLTKDLFYPNMVDSYHGIAHTTRVLFGTYLLAEILGLPESEKQACYYAAIIHDLGKSYDKEGNCHGRKSMLLYKDKIQEYGLGATIQNKILQAVEYHSIEDKDCSSDISSDIIWQILKDADALDRSRFNGEGCDKSYLRLPIYETERGQEVIELSSSLPSWTYNLEWQNPCVDLIEQVNKYIK